jgi:xanthine dehydrogenase molybdenum-binding subunit
MKNYLVVGKSIKRVEAEDKVTGRAKYTGDYNTVGLLHAEMLTSTYAHAEITNVDISKALKVSGVKAILTGKDYPYLTGSAIKDRPIIAIDRVRYYGEPVAVVVADSGSNAKMAASLIKVEYKQLPVVNSPIEALQPNATIIHEKLMEYSRSGEETYPEPNSNIANRTKIRKGNMNKG